MKTALPESVLKLESQKELIHETDWALLVILDACRYDSFNEIHSDYLKGNLTKVRSSGSSTGEWLLKTFPYEYGYTYLSTNPYINSLGLSLEKCNPSYPYKWKAKEHFRKIYDYWDKLWDKDLETVHPKTLTESAVKLKEKKMVVHYMQPHLPYLSLSSQGSFNDERKRAKGKKDGSGRSRGLAYVRDVISIVQHHLEKAVEPKIGTEPLWKIKRLLRLPTEKAYEKIWREAGGTEGLEHHYRQNLRTALEYVVMLVNEFPDKKIIITSDHGEAFGEDGMWFHKVETPIPILHEVPWFEVTGVVDN